MFHEGIRPYGVCVVQVFSFDGEEVMSACIVFRKRGERINAEKGGDVFVAVETVRDEKRDDDDGRERGDFRPIGDRRRFLHEAGENLAEDVFFADGFGLFLRGGAGVFV